MTTMNDLSTLVSTDTELDLETQTYVQKNKATVSICAHSYLR